MTAQHAELHRLIIGRTATTAVERILAAGYRKPQQVTTVEELDALPVWSVVLSDNIAHQKYDQDSYCWAADARFYSTSQITLPATVLHVGGAE